MTEEFWTLLLIGFAAQMVDGALGMAYGLTASSFMLASGLPPLQVSATVHLAECVTTGVSAISHQRFGNVDKELFKKLVVPGVLGAVVGACLLTTFPGEKLKPLVAGYILVMGLIVFAKAFTQIPPVRVSKRVRSLGFFGAMADAIGGGGWGPIVASTLLARGNEVRFTVGTVNAVEFFVTLASSVVFMFTVGLGLWKLVVPLALGGLDEVRFTVGTVNAVEFFVTLASSVVFMFTVGLGLWKLVVPLALGGLVAAPLAAYFCKKLPHRPLLACVGLLISAIALRTLLKSLA